MNTISNLLSHLQRLRKQRKAAAAMVAALSLVAAAGVFWQLRLTGISMTADPQCGYQVHAHGDGCSQVPVLSCGAQVHAHSDACRNEAGDLICGAMDLILHAHDSRCTGADGALVCTLAENSPHQHGDGCYTPAKIVTDPGHQHGDACYSYIRSSLTACGKEETPGHAHTDACVTAVIYGCGLTESDSHQHSADCGIQNGCGLAVTEGHAHTEECYPLVQDQLTCTQEVREPVTQDGEPELTCTQPVLQLHDHTEACRAGGLLTCGQMELKSHQHDDGCFHMETRDGQCQIQAHEHTDDCYPDLKADLETPGIWEDTLPQLQEDRWADNLIAVAQSQLGYTQSQRNFMADLPGQPSHYTRYGQWADKPYGDWRGQYISFCLHYAGIPEEAIPYGDSVADWAAAVEEYLVCPLQTAPQPGDVLFLDNDGDKIADAVGILAQALPKESTEEPSAQEPGLVTLQGNVNGQVAEVEYDSETVRPFLRLADAKVRYEKWLEENPEDTQPDDAAVETTECLPCQEKATEATGEAADTTEPTVPSGPRIITKHHEGSDYTITVTYTERAGLPETAQLKVKELLPGSPEYEDYYAQVKLVLGADNLVYTRLFDVTFLVDGKEVEPSGDVNVSIQYHEALVPATDKETTAQVVHFAETGTEVLPAEVQKDDRGITEISHTQDSFSVVAFALKLENYDNGPNKLLTDWYVFLDKKWTKVGSTRTGWRLQVENTTGGQEMIQYVTEAQAKYVLEPYGFTGGLDGANQLAYRKIQTYGEDPVMYPGIWNTVGNQDSDSKITYRLTKGGDAAAYCMYFIPGSNGDDTSDTGTEDSIYSRKGDVIGIYTVEVYDPDSEDYAVTETRPVRYVVHGSAATVTVPKGAVSEDNASLSKNPWAVFSARMDYLGPLTENKVTVAGSMGTVEDEGTDLQTVKIGPVTQPIRIARNTGNTVVDTTQAPDDLTVNYYVYMNDDWQKVGTTYYGWTINGRRAAGIQPYVDPNKKGSSAAYIDGKYARDVISIDQVTEVLGKYGFSPAVAKNSSSALDAETGKTADGADPVRIATLGYQPVGPTERAKVFVESNYDYRTTLFFPLGQSRQTANGAPQTPAGGYNVYFFPNGTEEDNYSDEYELSDEYPELVTLAHKNISYHVYVDGAWTKVSSSQYLIPGSTSNRDKIGMQQIRLALEPYGFPQSGDVAATELFYAPAGGTVSSGLGFSEDKAWYQLGYPADAPDGYNIYWLPGNTQVYTDVREVPITEDNIGGTFHLLTISDPYRVVYKDMDQIPRKYVRHNGDDFITVKQAPAGSDDWIMVGLDRDNVLVRMKDFTLLNGYTVEVGGTTYVRTEDEAAQTYTFTITHMTDTVVVTFPTASSDRSLSDNTADDKTADALGAAVVDPNIVFTMHNYSTRINELLKSKGLVSYSGEAEVDAVTGHTVWPQTEAQIQDTEFAFSGAGGIGASSSQSVDQDDFYQNHSTVRKNLDVNGYPMLALPDGDSDPSNDVDNDVPMDFLFGGSDAGKDGRGIPYIKNYMNIANTPLQIDNGQYRYFSYFNAVDFNTDDKLFYLRPYVERTEETALKHLTYDDYGDFLPFNHSGGQRISDRPYNFYQEDVDYWYGMTMKTQFYMTGDGTADDGKDMIFGFQGGDDTYVFIDNRLVLDMGGTHGAVTGTINFRTGLVQAYYDFDGVNASTDAGDLRYYATTLYDLFEDAMREAGESDITGTLNYYFERIGSEKVTDARGTPHDVYRLRSYTTHELTMFYMDRDSGSSNFNLQFNMPTLPEEDLTISLDTNYGSVQPSTDDREFYLNSEYHQFRIVNRAGTPLIGSANAIYRVQNLDGSYDGMTQAGVNGIFRIKSGQRVIVEDILAWVKNQKLDEYYVQELVPVQDIHSGMSVLGNGEAISDRKRVTIGEAEYYAYSQKIEVDREKPTAAFAPFTNVRKLDRVGYLRVGTELVPGLTCDESKLFHIQVSVNGALVPDQTRFYRVKDGKVSTTEFVRANDKGVIVIGPGTTYQMGAKLLAADARTGFGGYTYDVSQIETPKGWTLAYYLKEVTSTSSAFRSLLPLDEGTADDPDELPEGALTGSSIPGTITAEKVDTVIAVNKQAPITVGLTLNTKFLGLGSNDNINRTVVYEIIQVVPENCDTDTDTDTDIDSGMSNNCGGPFYPMPDGSVTVPGNLADYNNRRVTVVGGKDKTEKIQISYTEKVDASMQFHYRVRQLGLVDYPQGEAFIMDPREYVVTVDITADEGILVASISAIYSSTEGGNSIIFGKDCDHSSSNTDSTLYFENPRVGVRLPASGGPGTLAYIFSGTGCIGLSLLMYRYDKNRKRSRSNPTRGQRHNSRS